jgi:ADP-ribosylglycohydrolase.
LVWWSICGCDV